MAQGSNLSAKAQQTLGLPTGIKFYSPFPFAGLNTQDSALAIDDKEFPWIENFVRMGGGNLRTVWDVGTPLYTAVGHKIVYFCFYNIALTEYCAIFLDNGDAVQVNTTTLAVTNIGTGFYTSSGLLPYARQWGTQYLLICNRNSPNDYWAWDGSLLYTAGTAAPNGVVLTSGGSNYSGTPTVTAVGGEGTGMTFDVTVNAGSVVEVNITDPGSGYEVGDVVQLAFSGGGSDTSAVLEAYLNSGGVGGVNITSPGSGYTSATVSFSGGGGSGAAGTVQISTGVSSVAVTGAGTGYTYANISFTGGGGTGAAATAALSGGELIGINVTAAGSGYTSAPTVVITGPGSGATATATIAGGEVSGVLITDPGSGYTSAPSVTISGTGSGATATALLAPEGVAGVTVINGGTGFTSAPTITFEGGGGAGAVGTVVLVGTSIAALNLVAGGSGYLANPDVIITGSATNTNASALAFVSEGAVVKVELTSAGSGYEGPPTITFVAVPFEQDNVFIAAQGSGAAATAVLSPTSISGVLVSNSGQNYTNAPTVVVGAGANNAASATVNLMPYGVSGSAMETYLSRVWILNPGQNPFSIVPPGGQYLVSAAGSIWDFATSDGGLQGLNTDAFLETQYVNIRQSSGYIYFFGDGSISVGSNVTSSGTPVSTTFNYQNVDPQAGLLWRDALQDFGRATIIANNTGVYGLYGGAATKISGKADGIFRSAIFPPFEGAVTPSGATSTIFMIKHYMLLMTVTDPDTGEMRNVLLGWNEKDWGIFSQSVNFTFIGTQKNGSSYQAWGTDGTKLYPLFSKPSSGLIKRLDTKFYGADNAFLQKELKAAWMQASDMSSPPAGISGVLTIVASGIVYQNDYFPSVQNAIVSDWWVQQPDFAAGNSSSPFFSLWGSTPHSAPFTSVGLRFNSYSPDFVLGNLVLSWLPIAAFYGS